MSDPPNASAFLVARRKSRYFQFKKVEDTYRENLPLKKVVPWISARNVCESSVDLHPEGFLLEYNLFGSTLERRAVVVEASSLTLACSVTVENPVTT